MAAGKSRLLVVDGYNVLGAWPELSKGRPLADARDALIHRLHDYAGYSGQQVILVFDAWMSDRDRRTEEQLGGVTVVYTQKGEIADRYIERLCDSLAGDIELRRVEVRVASSDALEQTIVLGRGAVRMSARELMFEMAQLREAGIRRAEKPASRLNPIADHLPQEIRDRLEEMRKGYRK